jgi:hypothetical protein
MGTMTRQEYGFAPIIQFNDKRENEISSQKELNEDIELACRQLGVGFFHYGPRLWMIGEIEPLKRLLDPVRRNGQVNEIFSKYPSVVIGNEKNSIELENCRKIPIMIKSMTLLLLNYLGTVV